MSGHSIDPNSFSFNFNSQYFQPETGATSEESKSLSEFEKKQLQFEEENIKGLEDLRKEGTRSVPPDFERENFAGLRWGIDLSNNQLFDQPLTFKLQGACNELSLITNTGSQKAVPWNRKNPQSQKQSPVLNNTPVDENLRKERIKAEQIYKEGFAERNYEVSKIKGLFKGGVSEPAESFTKKTEQSKFSEENQKIFERCEVSIIEATKVEDFSSWDYSKGQSFPHTKLAKLAVKFLKRDFEIISSFTKFKFEKKLYWKNFSLTNKLLLTVSNTINSLDLMQTHPTLFPQNTMAFNEKITTKYNKKMPFLEPVEFPKKVK